MDLIREMLLWMEEHDDRLILLNEFKLFRDNRELTLAHIAMLKSAEFVVENDHRCLAITWQGHEFLDKVRDPEIWRKTKEGATKLNSWGVKLIGEMASGYIRAKAAELGIPLV
ncbi:DUF2513 domain-containing protein [Qipengyuania sp. ASV99]|uniref:DUF2513 domain-containing protein n=1 Tax=Qipengyuania sp. ASV99 TaxID=3399681 RepID=UPI003A4C67EA